MVESGGEDMTTHPSPTELLQNLIRFDTTNPPGNEAECIRYVDNVLSSAGFETTVIALDPKRPNLITRLAGRGNAPPLLLYGHVDVVTTESQEWQHPPFEGRMVDGYIWGRGALDMKGSVAMMLAAVLRARAETLTPSGDVVLAILSDEEAGGDYGARHLVENHAHLFKDIRYALGEFGAFTLHIGSRRLYPIMVAEKQICWMKASVSGPGGHGSLPMRGGAMATLARVLQTLDRRRLPVHVTPVARMMIEGTASALPFPRSALLRLLLNPHLNNRVLRLFGEQGSAFEPLFHNSVNATVVRGGEKINVIPGEIILELDGRLLPGYGPDDMMAELRQLLGVDMQLELIRHDPGPADPDMGLFETLSSVLRESDQEGVATPLLLPGVTDGRWFSRLGIQTYGFTPMKLPPGVDFLKTVHAADERIPVEALDFGTDAIYRVLERFR
jgi:acetylornithine deacetylase/succinyl-diaminopimelate desuccinylase-like protein